MSISIHETFAHTQILLLGGNGFLGKVLLLTLLEKVSTLNHIYLILRGTKTETAEERFLQTLETSPVFAALKARLKENFFPFIQSKVTVLSGDVSLPHFGLEDERMIEQLQAQVDLVINSAGLVTFNPELPLAVGSNLRGAIQAAEFTKRSKKGRLLHISTCFVAGNQSGLIAEEICSVTPNGTSLHLSEELAFLDELLKNRSKEEQIQAGIARAQALGWPNIYTYTKALSELWLNTQTGKFPFAIVRPSIVESSLSFPFSGWNEGFNTSAPLVQSAEGWYPFVIAKPEFPLDIIPVDILCAQIVKVGALLLSGQHQPVYQCATSVRHPLLMQKIMELTRKKQREQLQREPFSLTKRLKTWLNIRALSPEHPFSSFKLYSLSTKLPLHRSKALRRLSRHLQRLSKLHEILLPFLYEYGFTFASDKIDAIQVEEAEFNQTVDAIDWDHYWPNIHITGLQQWCFPKIED